MANGPLEVRRRVVYEVVRKQQVWEASRPGPPYKRELVVATFSSAHDAHTFRDLLSPPVKAKG